MRLCRPSVAAEQPLRCAPEDLGHPVRRGARGAGSCCALRAVPAQTLTRSVRTAGGPARHAWRAARRHHRLGAPLRAGRCAAHSRAPPLARSPLAHVPKPLRCSHASLARRRAEPSDAAGLHGALLVPQSFGAIHLGESFVSYVSVANFSGRAVTAVGIKAELQTDKTRAVLLDTTGAPLARMAPGERHDALVEADLKVAGAHTLVCSAVYTDADGERKYLPQYFKFSAANPLAVRTKARSRCAVLLRSAVRDVCTLTLLRGRCARCRAGGRCWRRALRT
jgi:hypothetical protein